MIYTLSLENDKHYVGFTEREGGERISEHFGGKGSEWTKIHKPVQVTSFVKGTLEDEKRVTLEHMQKYGWDNVRGGPYCHIEMNKAPVALAKQPPNYNITNELPKLQQRKSVKCTQVPVAQTQQPSAIKHNITNELPKLQQRRNTEHTQAQQQKYRKMCRNGKWFSVKE